MAGMHELRHRAIQLQSCTIDLRTGEIRRGSQEDRLSAKELACLEYLVARPGQAVSRDELLQQVWEYDPKVLSRTVDATVRRLRKKIEARPSDPVHLLTVHGAGYRMEGVRALGLSQQPPRLLGRDSLLATLALEPSRLLTLTGPPGIGKSDLARALSLSHADAVLWADLSPCDGDLEAYLPGALGLRAPLGEAFTVLPRPLLVLDNAQAHAQTLAQWLPDWLAAAPELRVLCTSRCALELPGERVVPVPPLDSDSACSLLGGDSPDHRELARALGHNPLALTLARQACQLLGPQAVTQRLRTQGEVFGLGSAQLHASVQASWTLLSDPERSLLSLASLAPAGLSLEVLERWVGPHALAAVQGLLRHALVQIRTGPAPRLVLPFPVGPFAQSHAPPGAEDAFREQMLSLGARCLEAFTGAGEEGARSRLLANAPNLLRAARGAGLDAERCLSLWALAVEDTLAPTTRLQTLEHALAGRLPAAPELALELSRVQHTLGRFEQAEASAAHGLGLSPDPQLALALMDWQAYAGNEIWERERVEALEDRAAALGLPAEQTLVWRVHRANRRRRYAAPEALLDLEAAWSEAHARSAHRLAAEVAGHLVAMYTWKGALADADALIQAALELVGNLGSWEGRGILLQHAANLALGQGRLDEARGLLDQAEQVWRALGRPYKLSVLNLSRGRILYLNGDPEGAIAELTRAVVTSTALGRPERGRTARVYRGLVRGVLEDHSAALQDLDVQVRTSPVLVVLTHCGRLFTHLRRGELQAAQRERAQAPETRMQALAEYQALSHAAVALLAGEPGARERIEAARGEGPPSMEFKLLWAHLDWALSQV